MVQGVSVGLLVESCSTANYHRCQKLFTENKANQPSTLKHNFGSTSATVEMI